MPASARYRDLDPSLPWVGIGPLGPRRLNEQDVRRIVTATDVAALALMLAYVRSYAGPAGGVVLGTLGGVVATARGNRGAALAAGVGTALLAMGVIETRRRAREWEAVILARFAQLGEQA